MGTKVLDGQQTLRWGEFFLICGSCLLAQMIFGRRNESGTDRAEKKKFSAPPFFDKCWKAI